MILAALLLGASYGEHLLRVTLARHHALSSISISLPETPNPIMLAVGKTTARSATAPLSNAMGEPIGKVTVSARKGHPSAFPVAADLARRIYVVANLTEPDPFVPGAKPSRFAQRLVDRALGDFPDLVTLALHVAPPGRGNLIIASSFGRIGKPGDPDDARIIATGVAAREVTNGGQRLAVETPLLDKAGRTVGALSMSFRLDGNGDAAATYARALLIRDALARRIPSLEILAAGAR